MVVVRVWWSSERVADSLYLCCCPNSVEWCVLDVLPSLDVLPRMRTDIMHVAL
jgi:hypothetical protein